MCINNKSNQIYDAYERLRAFYHCCQHTRTVHGACDYAYAVLLLVSTFNSAISNVLFLRHECVCAQHLYLKKKIAHIRSILFFSFFFVRVTILSFAVYCLYAQASWCMLSNSHL